MALELLPGPYEFWTPAKDVEISLLVVRFEVGLSVRSLRQPPYTAARPTLRLHVPPERKPDRPAYWDFTSTGLAHRVLALWMDAQDRALALDTDRGLAMLEATSPVRDRPLPLRITRRVAGDEILYEAELGRGA